MWKKFIKTAEQEMRDYIVGESLSGVSVAPGEIPKEGGKIARDAQGSRWYISPEFFSNNYAEVGMRNAPSYPWHHTEKDHKPSKGDIFLAHIKRHLCDDQTVICKMCGKTVDEICGE
jgi:hypothetical protein